MFLNVCMYVFQTECLQLDCIVGRTMLLEEPRLSHVVTCSFYLFCTCLPSSSDDSASCGKPSHCPVTCSHDTIELLSDGLCCVITCPPEDRGLCLPDLGCGCSFWPNSCLGECSWNEWGGSACRWPPVQGWATPAVYSYLCMVRQACGCFLNCCVVVPSLGSAHWSRMKGNGSTCFCLKNANFFLKCVL